MMAPMMSKKVPVNVLVLSSMAPLGIPIKWYYGARFLKNVPIFEKKGGGVLMLLKTTLHLKTKAQYSCSDKGCTSTPGHDPGIHNRDTARHADWVPGYSCRDVVHGDVY